MTTKVQTIATVRKNAEVMQQRVNEIFAIVNDNKVVVPQRYSISYMLGNQGVSRIFTESDIYEEESRLADTLRAIGVAELDDNSLVEHVDGVLSYILEDMKGDTLIIPGSRIRYTAKSQNPRPRQMTYNWKTLAANVEIIINKLPETDEERKIAENIVTDEIINKLIGAGILNKDGSLIA